MATKTISVRLEAYEQLCRARRYPGESFSQVVLRASWPEETVTGAELLERRRSEPDRLAEEDLERIAAADQTDAPPADPWTGR